MHKSLFLRAVVTLPLCLGALAACSDDSGDTGGEVTRDAAIADASRPDAGGTLDGATSTPDAGATDAAATDAAAKPDASLGTIVDVAVADGRFTTLAGALMSADLVGALSGEGPFTVFAPTDAAFAKLPPGTLTSLTPAQLTTILKYHVLSGRAPSSSLMTKPVDTLAELSAFVSVEGATVKVNDANVTTADVQASNGVIHVIDTVLLPPNLVEAAQYAGAFSTLISAVGTAGLADALTDPNATLTVFAPTDAAFAALPEGTVAGLSMMQLADVLKYHVLPTEVLSTQLVAGKVDTLLTGAQLTVSLTGGAMVNDAKVVIADVRTTNGVIHAIDKVLLPPN